MTRHFLSSAVVIAALAMGCEQKQETPAASATPAPGSSAEQPANTAQTAAAQAPKTAEANATAAQTAAGTATADAQAKLDQVLQYIKDNKLDLADKSLAELESNKASLPEAVASKLASARTALDAAKLSGAKDSMKMPAAPALPK